jgi:hypothetical protein
MELGLHACSSAFYTPENTEWISMKYGIRMATLKADPV